MTPLNRFLADHKFLLAAVADAAGIADPVAVDLDDFFNPVLEKATRGPVVPLDGVLIRDWDPDYRRFWPGLRFGGRLYTLAGVRFARAYASVTDTPASVGYDFFAVARADYPRFYKLALRCRRKGKAPAAPPVLPAGHLETLSRNTIGFLAAPNLKKIKEYGGRPKRGVLLAGPPGNGKTSACRWVLQQCQAAGHEHRFVSPDDYRAARNATDPADAVRRLFQFGRPGIVFFDDMDTALQDRTEGGDDQAVFLQALDGMEAPEGVVYVFATNRDPAAIDPAMRRPGRIDVVLNFPTPPADLRRELIGRWHPDIVAALDLPAVVGETDGLSFAELDELRNLLVMRFMDAGRWEWRWAADQFEANRRKLKGRRAVVGFAGGAGRAVANGQSH